MAQRQIAYPFRTASKIISFKVLDHTQWPGTRPFCTIFDADRRIPLFREYEKMVATKVKNPQAPRVRPLYLGEIEKERFAKSIPPPEKDRMLIAMIQVDTAMPKANFHCIATSEVKVQYLPKRGGKNAKLRKNEGEPITTVVSINEPYPDSHDIDVVSRVTFFWNNIE